MSDYRDKAAELRRHVVWASNEAIDTISQALLEAHNAGRAEMREEAAKAENEDGIYRCCGCGLPVLMGNVKPCDCVTEVAFRRDLKGPSIRMAERGPLDRLATAIRSIT